MLLAAKMAGHNHISIDGTPDRNRPYQIVLLLMPRYMHKDLICVIGQRVLLVYHSGSVGMCDRMVRRRHIDNVNVINTNPKAKSSTGIFIGILIPDIASSE